MEVSSTPEGPAGKTPTWSGGVVRGGKGAMRRVGRRVWEEGLGGGWGGVRVRVRVGLGG